MKFITRELYQGMQAPSGTAGEFESQWRLACDAYQAEIARIRPMLPAGMQALSNITLHDGIVREVTRPSASVLVLEVDAMRNPWGPRGIFRLKFTGVREVDGAANLVGDDWLYEEVHLHPAGGFEYHILFWRSDVQISAAEVELVQLHGLEARLQEKKDIEGATVRAFIIPTKRDRYARLLGNPRMRAKILDGLNHCSDFDARYATVLPSTTDVTALLRSNGAPATCHVISDFRQIDGQQMPVEAAIGQAEGSGFGTLLCCIPDRLAYYVAESGEQRLLLRRNTD